MGIKAYSLYCMVYILTNVLYPPVNVTDNNFTDLETAVLCVPALCIDSGVTDLCTNCHAVSF